MTDQPITEPFDPTDGCLTDPALGCNPDASCVLIEPCTLRCHLRWLDGQHQPNDAAADRQRAAWLADNPDTTAAR